MNGQVVGNNNQKQFVVFSLEAENYGIEISAVKEIVKWSSITELPNMPPEMAGVIKLREEVIPVISLHRQFGLTDPQNLEDTKIVILEVGGRTIGINVDDVEEVINVPSSSVQTEGLTDQNKMVEGIAKLEGYLLILLDVNYLFAETAADEIAELSV